MGDRQTRRERLGGAESWKGCKRRAAQRRRGVELYSVVGHQKGEQTSRREPRPLRLLEQCCQLPVVTATMGQDTSMPECVLDLLVFERGEFKHHAVGPKLSLLSSSFRLLRRVLAATLPLASLTRLSLSPRTLL